VSFTCTPNPTPAQQRIAFVYVTGNGQTDTVKVIQGAFSLLNTVVVDEKISLQLFPNPATDQISISGNTYLNIHSIDVFNITGQKMSTRVFASPNGNPTVMVNELNPGIYIVRIVTDKREYTTRFIKM